jgi:hypothetical protein
MVAARLGSWAVEVTRPHPRMTLFDVSLSDYREFFAVAEGEHSLTIVMHEPDAIYKEAQVFVFQKPYGWLDDLDDDEALQQVWQAVGVVR